MDWTGKQECVKCERGGKLLVCNVDDCPISVHEGCMISCRPQFDELGNFNCPCCLFKRYTAEKYQLKKKAILSKKGSETFLDENLRAGKNQKPNKEEEVPSKEKTCFEDGVQNQSEETLGTSIPKRTGEIPDGMVKDDQLESNVSKKIEPDNQTEKAKPKFDDHPKMIGEASSINVSPEGEHKDSVINRGMKQKGSRVCWTDEEKDMLKKGVEKFSEITRKNLPWKKILKFGHHIFDSSRTPSDLKDKWRKMGK